MLLEGYGGHLLLAYVRSGPVSTLVVLTNNKGKLPLNYSYSSFYEERTTLASLRPCNSTRFHTYFFSTERIARSQNRFYKLTWSNDEKRKDSILASRPLGYSRDCCLFDECIPMYNHVYTCIPLGTPRAHSDRQGLYFSDRQGLYFSVRQGLFW